MRQANGRHLGAYTGLTWLAVLPHNDPGVHILVCRAGDFERELRYGRLRDGQSSKRAGAPHVGHCPQLGPSQLPGPSQLREGRAAPACALPT